MRKRNKQVNIINIKKESSVNKMDIKKENIIEPSINSLSIKEKQEAQLAKEMESMIPSAWKLSKKKKQAVNKGISMFSTSFGLYAAVPLLCKGEDCPYAKLFPDLHEGAVEDGERCPVEVSFIMSKYNKYIDELNISEDDAVDMSLLRDLIDFDVQILRADNKIALDGGFLENQVVTVSETTGEPIYQEMISNAANYKDKIQVKRNKTLEMLNSTRKDKAGSKINHVIDPSSYATQLARKISEKDTIAADFTELNIIEDVDYMKELKKQKIKSEEEILDGEQRLLSFEELYGDDK